jgi:5-formyltetrahydrofolate cyclo-ligase
MNKKEARQKYKAARQTLSAEEIEAKSLAIANQLLVLDIWKNTYFHLFLPMEQQKEVDTEFILQILAGKDKEVVIARSDFQYLKMTHFLLTDNSKFSVNDYGIPEPVDGLEVPVTKIDVVFVPLLAYDIQGNRVGYGKGFYDIFLSECKPETVKIGLSFFEPEVVISNVSPTDIRLDYCISPERIFIF